MWIGVVEADAAVRDWLADVLHTTGLAVKSYARGDEFLASLPMPDAACLVAYMLLPDMTGLDLEVQLKVLRVAIPIVFVSAHADVPTAFKAMKAGAVDFLEKPLRAQEVLAAVQWPSPGQRGVVSSKAPRPRSMG